MGGLIGMIMVGTDQHIVILEYAVLECEERQRT